MRIGWLSAMMHDSPALIGRDCILGRTVEIGKNHLNDEEIEAMRYIRFKELKQRVPLGRTTIWRMMRDRRFPQSRRIGKAAMAWLENEIEEWIKQRPSARE